MAPWAAFVTCERLDAAAQATLGHLFSHDKRSVALDYSYVDYGVLEVGFLVPWRDGVGTFVLCMDGRSETHRLRYLVPLDGPFAGVAPPLADAIAVELVAALLKKMVWTRSFLEPGEYGATFAPLVRLATRLCASGRVSEARAAVRQAALLDDAASAADMYTCATDDEVRVATALAARARNAACLARLAFAVRVGVLLMRWKGACLERMYAPGGAGFRLAQASFEAVR